MSRREELQALNNQLVAVTEASVSACGPSTERQHVLERLLLVTMRCC